MHRFKPGRWRDVYRHIDSDRGCGRRKDHIRHSANLFHSRIQPNSAIGGVNVPVFFAGPTPGFTGLYQVNATLPTGITASQAAPLLLTQGGHASVMVTIPVQ